MELLQKALANVNDLGGQTLAVAMLLAAIGTLAMTAVETVANLWRGQMRMHRSLFQAWVRADLTAVWSRMHAWVGKGDLDTPSRQALNKLEPGPAEVQFLVLACGDVRHAQILFDQPAEKFAAQLQAAANVALEYPAQYESLYQFLTMPLNATSTQVDQDAYSDAARWLHFCRLPPAQQVGEPAAAAMKARARLGNMVARRLDVFQNAARYRWDRLRQWSASVLAGLLAAWIATQLNWEANPVLAFTFVLMAGALAPFAKGVVNSLSSFQAKPKG